jgi:hypothetical protein
MEFYVSRDYVVGRFRTEFLQKGPHPIPHSDRTWTDELDVDIPIVHKFEMALLRGRQLLIRNFQFSAGCIL